MKAADNTTASRGREAEQLAEKFLTQRGLAVVARNFRVRGGEIDLVCRDGRELVFVEVRLRQHGGFGGALESITAGKRQRLLLAARHFLATQARDWPCRFDCVLLDGLELSAIEWLKHAFDAD